MKPWKCRNCSEWNTKLKGRCETCAANRERVEMRSRPELAAQQARVCAAVPGLAAVFAEIARGLRTYAAVHGIDVITIDPHTIVTPGGRVIVEINPASP